MWQNGNTGKGLKEVFDDDQDELDQAKVVDTELIVLEKIRNLFLYIISISISTPPPPLSSFVINTVEHS